MSSSIQEALAHDRPFDFETSIQRPDGTVRRVRSQGERMRDDSTGQDSLIGVFMDITSSHRDRIALVHAANHDLLTGLYNRLHFDRLLVEKIAASQGQRGALSLILIDLDGFKDVNDTFGHLNGDYVLAQTAQRIARATPKQAVVARWGGDEFALLAPPGASREQLEFIARRITEAVRQDINVPGGKISVGATCGVAVHDGLIEGKELVRRADLALYHGKKYEPGQTHFYYDTLERSNHARQIAVAEVKSALANQRICAGYQPIVRLEDKAIVGFEALMRLDTDSGVRMTASEVLPALLDPVLSREIGNRMLGFVCRDMSVMQAAHNGLRFVSVNATEADILSRDFAENFLATLRDKQIAPHSVALEVTETMLLVNDTRRAQRVLTTLHDAGVRIALDDFGTGFSSLSHLRDFPIDKVKIDRSFVETICSVHQNRMIVQALISMAHNLGIKVIAEGIETEDQRALLMQMGCHLGQGYLISTARTLREVTRPAATTGQHRAPPTDQRGRWKAPVPRAVNSR
ncbi:EAL domain-containing protein [Qipengyuania marisflavi]|uniref:EAL domain-containing protein n=1 Tax=Qipengyuania marisflavi TaxID=2486356 RepID=A0A5S3P5T1_9SPHN|nr:EAL domain-containing protein [Qipengyuania marisflavi]